MTLLMTGLGHTRSWAKAFPELLTECYLNGKPTGEYGNLNPARITTYHFLKILFHEIKEVFPDSYIHIGGDEVVKTSCW